MESISPTSDASEQLKCYRDHIELDARFSIPSSSNDDSRTILRRAISALWSPVLERTLDIHLPSFFTHIATEVSTLQQLLQLASQGCAVEVLTDQAMKLVDQAYVAAGTHEQINYDCVMPNEVHRLAGGDYLLTYAKHHELAADVTVCLCTEDFSVPHDNYRSYRINALAGPRVRRDCSSVKKRLPTRSKAIITRGYFSAWRFIIHCPRPFADSELATHQRMRIREAYIDSLELASKCDAKTVSLPLIAPQGSASTEMKAYRTAVEAIVSARAAGWRFRTVYLTGVPNRESAMKSTF